MRLPVSFSVCLLVVFGSSAQAVQARTWHIQPDGSGDAPTIQAGIDSATSGDSIVVAAGVYDENLLVPTGKNIVLRGLSGAQTTVVDGGHRGIVLTLRGTGVVEGFTFRRGQGPVGGGITIIGSWDAVIRNNIIEDNIAEDPGFGSGGGVYLHWDTEGILVESNIIRNNRSGEEGGGIRVRGGYVRVNELRNNVISNNSSYLGGGGVSTFQARLLGNVIANNSTLTFGGGIFVELDGGGEIRGNTIVGNVIGYPGEGAGIKTAGSPLISHNIIAHNVSEVGVGAGVDCYGAFAHPTLECNDVWGNGDDSIAGCGTTGPGNFSADPLFCDPANGNYSLYPQSPCLPANNSCGALIGARGPCPVSDVDDVAPAAVTLRITPNPPTATAMITYRIAPATQNARLLVYDLRGRVVARLANAEPMRSHGSVIWDGRDAAGVQVGSGVYIVRLEAEGGSASRKIAWIR